MQPTHDPTETYLETLLTGDRYRLLGDFAAEPVINDPLGGRVRDLGAFNRFFDERQAWLVARQARLEPLRTTRKDQLTVCENLVHLQLPEGEVALPVAVVGEHTAHNRLQAIRVYHSLWPLIGAHRVRPPLLPRDPALKLTDVIAEYQKALHDGDIPGIVAAFEEDGYFREPAGGEYFYRGRQKLLEIHDPPAQLGRHPPGALHRHRRWRRLRHRVQRRPLWTARFAAPGRRGRLRARPLRSSARRPRLRRRQRGSPGRLLTFRP